MVHKGVKTITNNLESIRKEKGLTQVELAAKLNVQQSTISHIENGERNPSAELLCNLAEALGVTIDELIGKKAG